jgi:hypothetical protein
VDAVPTNSLRMLAHVPAIGGAVLRLIHAILANADPDLGLRELAILRVTQRDQARYAWTQHAAVTKRSTLAKVRSMHWSTAKSQQNSSPAGNVLSLLLSMRLSISPGSRMKHSPGLRRNSLDPWPLRTAVSRE